jgi:hypothetical protein
MQNKYNKNQTLLKGKKSQSLSEKNPSCMVAQERTILQAQSPKHFSQFLLPCYLHQTSPELPE